MVAGTKQVSETAGKPPFQVFYAPTSDILNHSPPIDVAAPKKATDGPNSFTKPTISSHVFIVENVTEQFELCALKVRDKDGKMTRVIFNFIGDDIKKFDWGSVQVGCTIAILYPEQRVQPTLGIRALLAGQSGGREGSFLLKEPSRVKILQCDLETLLNINDTVGSEILPIPGKSRKCENCHAEETDRLKLLRCSSCQSAPYCSQECQKDSWKKEHKRLCQTFKDVREIKTARNWNKSAFSKALGFGERSEERKETLDDLGNQSDDEQDYGANYRPYYGWDGVDVDADIEDILWGSYSDGDEDDYEGYDSDEFGPASSEVDEDEGNDDSVPHEDKNSSNVH
ncbi:hypothetical protein VNI00_012775 [Paramarasmius palmivorus]|uniref:MYND-type domain-containing protein n=1 Tax=Paramarasmius palmivorus TaxID=297713 RepID=A0AAW0C4Y9_9AGAR